ncbi:protein CNGC15c-like [Durio zibethinus]|uniref:Protein CNGC15c-like n=1 Tax=Durio zibethinus TaxID=66656 RepID=A0A6P5XQ38_DURZI|nr:protein CNGC15c-like [Durio zibethinus]XP_022730287.1 protein CNGC15c-like [Durio zibethinus]XP_022730288.1 protein CNGC15c-like [Durio zibethinus]XP_022730289.1 protein CNGC15c-like [Durio zibethinus]XP_022730290.1 protein CNGC15c-like [Durio zibethinus]XP_022730291.1 protein CNGC15c-like [Durio zibethinus]
MGFGNSRSVRFQDDLKLAKLPTINGEGMIKLKYNIDGTQISESSTKRAEKELPSSGTGKSLKTKVLYRVFSEDFERVKKKILDPRGPIIRRWNKIFLVACLVSLFVDPLFFFLPVVWDEVCIDIGIPLEVVLTMVRSLADAFYIIQIFIRFRTAYIAPPSRVFGRGELVIDSRKIASRYLQKSFWIDLIAALPLPQVLIWIIIPNLKGSTMTNTKNVLRFIIIFQYLPRLFLIFPLSSQIVEATGVVTETAWAGAAYNLMLYMLASHVLGACWYLLAIERQEACWRTACDLEDSSCQYKYFDCHSVKDPGRGNWLRSSNITNLCSPSSSFYEFGIYGDALTFGVTTSPFFNKYFYCLWWGLRNLSSLGQNLSTSTYVGEIIFAIIIATVGLVLFALLIGNMQTYLQSTTVRLEEWRIKRTDTEQWMRHRQLPPELRQSVRRYDQYKWVATRGVDEEALLKGLPLDLRRDIKRHLCLDLVRRVPLFDQMDERMLDAICERLKPALCTEGTFLVREGDPVNEMLFIIRGHLDSHTTNGGRTGFFNSCRIGPGDFCGEELLTWALDPRPSVILPSSTRTVKAISEVEAFALRAEDLKFVASQFRRLHSKQLRHKFRFYSHQWRTWAACFIQAAWRRFKKRKEAAELRAKENLMAAEPEPEPEPTPPGSGVATYAARLATSTRRGVNMHSGSGSGVVSSLPKPAEPDFSVDEE